MSPRFSSLFGRVLLALIVVFAGVTAVAQTTPAPANPPQAPSASSDESPSKIDVFAGYSFLSPNGAINGNKGIPKGFTVASSYWVNKYLGAVLETGSHFGDIN